MGAEPLSRHAMPSRGGGEMGHSPCGYSQPLPKLFFYILRPRGFIFNKFWPIWLSVLALLRKAFAA